MDYALCIPALESAIMGLRCVIASLRCGDPVEAAEAIRSDLELIRDALLCVQLAVLDHAAAVREDDDSFSKIADRAYAEVSGEVCHGS